MAGVNHMTDDQLASARIKNYVEMSSLEKTMDEQLIKLKNGDGYLLFYLLENMIHYMRELRRWQELHDNRR